MYLVMNTVLPLLCFACVGLAGQRPALAAISPNPVVLPGRGNTPLHRAALAGDAQGVQRLLATGADARATNDAGATPLHYGVASERVVELLLQAGADPNARSMAGGTPLHSATARHNALPVVKQLVEAGARVNEVRYPERPSGPPMSPLSLAAGAGDERTVRFLLLHGASAGGGCGTNDSLSPVAAAAFAGHDRILKLLVAHGGSVNGNDQFAGHALNIAAYAAHRQLIPYLLEQGADLHLKSPAGERVPPMVWSAYDESGDSTMARALLARGVDIDEASSDGSTALSWALKRGETPLVAFLRSRGAKEPLALKNKQLPNNLVPPDTAGRERMIRDGAQRAITLLQRSSDAFLDNGFVKQVSCVSCHHQTLPAVAFAEARKRGFQIDESSLARQSSAQQASWSRTRDRAYEMHAPQPAPAAVIGYGLHGLHALRYQPDELTAAMSWYLAETQSPDGSWPDFDFRPPMEEGPIAGTALTVRALQYYPPPAGTRRLKERIQQARRWLERCEPRDFNQRIFRYHGLGWAGATASELRRETQALTALQRPDGGWSALPTLESDAWTTGHLLVALHEVGDVAAQDPAYQRGVEFLLRTQFPDGSWWVKSRTWPFQPHFDSQFPHGKDQWISAGGTAWALLALLNTLRPAASAGDWPTAQALMARHARSDGQKLKAGTAATPTPSSRFAGQILPFLQRSCVGCHGGETPKGNFRVETVAALLHGGQSGDPAVVPGKPGASPLLRYVSDQIEDLEMPPLGKRAKYPALSDVEIEKLKAWIADGAN